MKNKLLNILTAVTLFLIPNVNFGQAPSLGTAANFALFTTNGLVKNTGTTYLTHITGNVGSNIGPVTGFGNVDGVMAYTADPLSTQAATDLLAAYGQLNAVTPTNNTLAPLLGSGPGQILFGGVYSITNASITLDQNLILDAQGDSSKVFIFQLQGAFSTTAGSKVKLINGALACKVFWKVEGLVDMATQTSMKGTIIANNAAINMATLDSLEGRALSINGAINVTGVLVYTPIGCASMVLTGPAAPALNSAACYAIFTSNGALVNGAPNSTSIGDVGSNGGGSITGWNAGMVTGTLHLIQDPSTIACAVDLSNAYNALNALLIDIELLAPMELGHSLVLTPHTYHMGGNAFITDTLILNAEGNPNAVFVIKITGGNLTTGTYANIKLINGTKSQNVFWMVQGGYVDINNYVVFRGTIIVPVGAINLVNTGVVLDGRAFTMNGAITTTGLVAIMPPGCSSSPIIVTPPVNQIVCSGDTANFSVSATGSGLTYQWRKGNIDLINAGNISGADSAKLVIFPANVSDTSSFYNVIVSGSLLPNDTSINVSLTVNTAPNITTQPANQTLCLGGSASFSVAASGSGLTYQWRKGLTNILGATASIFTINPVGILDTAYNYNVVVSGTCSPKDTSVNVFLRLNSAPNITSQPANQTACPGSSVSFSAVAAGTGLSYQWRKGITNILGANTASFTINPVSISDTAYNYNVVVSGTCALKDTSINVSLSVSTSPAITTQPASQVVCAGSSVIFSAAASGGSLSYQWRKGITNILGANTASLTINPVGITDTAYNYNVVVTGTCTLKDTSINVSLTVNTAPAITIEPINKTVCAGTSVNFSVTASGTGLTYQWRRGLSNITGANSAVLTINPVSVSDTAYNYNVVISGACAPNAASVNVSLSVNPVPPAIEGSNSPICAGSLGSSINLTAQTVTGASYLWTGPNGFSSALQNPVIPAPTTADAGNYSLTVLLNGCSSGTSTIPVVVNNCLSDLSIVKTVNNSTPLIGRIIVFTITASNNGPDNATGVSVNDVLQSGYTYVSSSATAGTFDQAAGVWTIGTLNNGASATLTVTVRVIAGGNYVNTAIIYGSEADPIMANNVSSVEPIPTDFFIPEGFSPNGDGTNDLFVIRGILNYPANSFVIFNRWGNKVFEASPYQNTWDGRSEMGLRAGGDQLPVGTYFYILNLNDGSDIFKGTIYLNR